MQIKTKSLWWKLCHQTANVFNPNHVVNLGKYSMFKGNPGSLLQSRCTTLSYQLWSSIMLSDNLNILYTLKVTHIHLHTSTSSTLLWVSFTWRFFIPIISHGRSGIYFLVWWSPCMKNLKFKNLIFKHIIQYNRFCY